MDSLSNPVVSPPQPAPAAPTGSHRRGPIGAWARQVRIRQARSEDIDGIAEVEVSCFSAPWSRETFQSLVGRAHVDLLIAEVEPFAQGAGWPTAPTASPEVVGHGILWCAQSEAELANLAVAPAFRGRGIGRALLRQLIRGASNGGVRSVFLEVRASNEAALALYLRQGFRQVGIRKHY